MGPLKELISSWGLRSQKVLWKFKEKKGVYWWDEEGSVREIPEGFGRILTGGDDGDRTECSKYIRWRGGEVQAKEAVTEIEYM